MHRDLQKQLKKEGKLLGIKRISIDCSSNNAYIPFIETLLPAILELKKDVSSNDQVIKNEIECLNDFLSNLFLDNEFDAHHITGYKFAIMLNAVSISRDNLVRLKAFPIAEKLNGIFTDNLVASGFAKENIRSITSNYPSNKLFVKQQVKRLLLHLKSVIAHYSFWGGRSNFPFIISLIEIIKNDFLSDSDKWEKIKKCEENLSRWETPHEDISALCSAILKEDIDAFLVLEKKAGEEETNVPFTPCSSMRR